MLRNRNAMEISAAGYIYPLLLGKTRSVNVTQWNSLLLVYLPEGPEFERESEGEF
jgi:hypothetical protein